MVFDINQRGKMYATMAGWFAAEILKKRPVKAGRQG